MIIKYIFNKAVFTIVFVICATFYLTDLMLKTFQPEEKHDNAQSFTSADNVLGWKNISGTFEYLPYVLGDKNIHVTILNDKRRATNPVDLHFNEDEADVILLGCSYVFGWGLSDQETLAWKLQSKHPKLKISNYGVPGYSTYQALLALKQILPRIRKPKVVIYGFMYEHMLRNLAMQAWLPKNTPVPIPYVDLNSQNQIVFKETHNSKSVMYSSVVQSSIIERANSKRYSDKINSSAFKQKMLSITEKILLDMHALSAQHGAKFYPVILEVQSREIPNYFTHNTDLEAQMVDCDQGDTTTLRIVNDGHPNAIVHSRWANCISEKISLNLIHSTHTK